jgi:hypothetical protein
MVRVSYTAEGFRAAFRRPSLTLAEIVWRWTVGATAVALFIFALVEYLHTLPVTDRELLFLRTRQPYLIGQVIEHILRGSLDRVVLATLVTWLSLCGLWILAASIGRMVTVRDLLGYFADRRDLASDASPGLRANRSGSNPPLRALIRLNFLRVVLVLAAIFSLVGAAILASFASPAANPQPGMAFFLFLPLAGLVGFIWWALNWFLSLAEIFAIRDGEDAMGAIFAAVTFCRERTGAVFAVSIWTGLAHMTAFVTATTAISMPLGFVAVVPWRLVVACMILVTLFYFVVADWIYMARLAGYVCIAEIPQTSLIPAPFPPHQPYTAPPTRSPQTSIDRDETILSDMPGSADTMEPESNSACVFLRREYFSLALLPADTIWVGGGRSCRCSGVREQRYHGLRFERRVMNILRNMSRPVAGQYESFFRDGLVCFRRGDVLHIQEIFLAALKGPEILFRRDDCSPVNRQLAAWPSGHD